MTQLTPYLSFEGTCAEAMAFYKSCLGGELTVQKVGDSPMKSEDPRHNDQVMHSELTSGDIHLMASDLVMEGHVTRGVNVTLTIHGDNKEEIEDYFSKLSEGGKVSHKFEETFFGYYGDLTDKYGINWAFQSDKK